MTRPSPARIYSLFGLMLLCWAFGFIVVKITLRGGIPDLIMPGWRAALTTLILIPIGIWDHRNNKHERWKWADAPKMFVAATCGVAVNQLTYVLALNRTSVAHSSLVVSTMPLVVFLMAVFMGQEKPRFIRLAGMFIAMAGVATLQLSKGAAGVATAYGDFLAIINTVAFALYAVMGRALTQRYGPVFVTVVAHMVGTAVLLPVGWIWGQPVVLANITLEGWLGLAYLVILQGVVGYLIFYYLLRFIPASRVTMFTYIQPVIATVAAYFILSEPVNQGLFLGGLMILAGVWTAERIK